MPSTSSIFCPQSFSEIYPALGHLTDAHRDLSITTTAAEEPPVHAHPAGRLLLKSLLKA